METTRSLKQFGIGEAAVEGLMGGILAGIGMGVFILVVELLAGANPLAVLSGFDATTGGSPIAGVFTHLAVAAVYGVIFGMLALVLARFGGARLNRVVWLALGALYGLLIYGVAEWFILPRTDSLLTELQVWAFGTAHLIYGIILAWVISRNS